jgi:putative flippase GtrA
MDPLLKNQEFAARAFRYIAIAFIAYTIDIGGYVLMLYLGIKPILANACIKIVAAFFGFFMHRKFTYQIKGKKKIRTHAMRYFGMALLYTPLSSFVLFVCLQLFHDPVFSKFFSDVILIFITYLITTTYTFK